jgi:hypothetical protein
MQRNGDRVGGVTIQAACGALHIIALWRLLAVAGSDAQRAQQLRKAV